MECGQNDCFNCPYKDCIVPTEAIVVPKAKTGRKPLTPEEKAQRKRERSKRLYYRKREERLLQMREYYYRKKEAANQ